MMTQHKYTSRDKMVTLISDNYSLVQVMSRFGIKVGFGDKTVEEVCNDSGVDCDTFLTTVNLVLNEYTDPDNIANISIPTLLQYLRQSHTYFLEYCLPAVRRKLLDGIKLSTTDVSFLMIKLFDEYVNEVKTHMEYEEQLIFSYVNDLLTGKTTDKFKIATYSSHHDEVNIKLTELKNLIIKYCPPSADINLLNDALYDIYRCEQELKSHCMVEDYIFMPSISELENRSIKK